MNPSSYLLLVVLVDHSVQLEQDITGGRVENSKGDHSESPLGDFRGPFFWQKGDQKETFLWTKGDFYQSWIFHSLIQINLKKQR